MDKRNVIEVVDRLLEAMEDELDSTHLSLEFNDAWDEVIELMADLEEEEEEED